MQLGGGSSYPTTISRTARTTVQRVARPTSSRANLSARRQVCTTSIEDVQAYRGIDGSIFRVHIPTSWVQSDTTFVNPAIDESLLLSQNSYRGLGPGTAQVLAGECGCRDR